MSRVYSDTVLPEDSGVSQDFTFGTTGDTVQVTSGATLKVNTLKDSGGNTIFTSDGSGNVSSVNSGLSGAPVLITTNTVTDGAASAFTTGIDNTYKLYIFKFINIAPATDGANFYWQGSINAGVAYGVTTTTTCFNAYQNEAGSDNNLTYQDSLDQALSTDYMYFANTIGNGADECCAGELYLFNPSSTTSYKMFYTKSEWYGWSDYMPIEWHGGYFKTTSAINALNFKMSAGNFDGIIKMYGL